MGITYRIGNIEDLKIITELSVLLYCGDYSKKHEYDELFTSNEEDLKHPKMAFFLAFDNDKAIGFSHVYIRHEYVIGTKHSPVGYLEGIYVCSNFRGQGVAKTLVEMSENWSKENGCLEFASDCVLENKDSLAFHLKIGFYETNRLIHFAKKL